MKIICGSPVCCLNLETPNGINSTFEKAPVPNHVISRFPPFGKGSRTSKEIKACETRAQLHSNRTYNLSSNPEACRTKSLSFTAEMPSNYNIVHIIHTEDE
ncbi:hypothetical protein M758_9G009800 [Ceratodon purpureus]|nr:hypothetical protein M758_9G009800 [Ceratodon purpureus]